MAAKKENSEESEGVVVIPEVEIPEAPKEEAEEEDFEQTVETLKAQLAEKDTQLAAANTKASELAERELGARGEVHNSNLALVTNAIATLNQAEEVLTSNYAQALADQDYTEAANIQRQMAKNSAQLLQLEQGKQQMEAAPAPVREVPADPVEALASQLTPRSAAWVRNNPQFATNERLYQKMIGAHNLVVGDGYTPDTDDYFAAIEGILKPRTQTEVADPMADAAKPRSAPPAAPVSRGNGSGNTVTLSADEREMAKLNNMTVEEYAKAKMDLQKEGKLNS